MLVFDIGGTFIKYAIIEQGDITYQSKIATADGRHIGNQLLQTYVELSKTYSIKQIAIASAGQIDTRTGKVMYAAPTIPNYTGVELAAAFANYPNIKLYFENDVNACAYNYLDQQESLFIAIGTGIGAALVHERHVFKGANGIGIEIGQLKQSNGKAFEHNASTSALLQQYQQQTGELISGEILDQKWRQKEPEAQKLIQQFYHFLAEGIMELSNLYDVQHIVLGGGITAASFFDSNKILQAIEAMEPGFTLRKGLTIEHAQLGNNAQLIGMYKRASMQIKKGLD